MEDGEIMTYTIGEFDHVHGGIKIDINKSGNNYYVGIWDKEMHSSVTKTFGNLLDAYRVYEKLVSWCVFSCYSTDDKKYFLINGTMKR